MNDKSKINKLIFKSAYVVIIVLIITVIALLILKYQVEGEKNMPFKLSSIIIVSNAEGYQKTENEEYNWYANIYQINDIYLNIEKNKNYKETEIIKSIEINNIKVNKEPKVGKISFYRPAANEETGLFNYEEKYKIDKGIEYLGDIKSDLSNLKISNQGGTIILRELNETGKEYKSNKEEIEHSGKLLNEVKVTNSEVKNIISFDLVINLESEISFKTKIELELPVGDITKEGYVSTAITDMDNIIFKREQKK